MELPLYPYQRDTANFMLKGSCINASFCGSGKTITTLAAIHEQGHQVNLIVCPKSVLYNWQNEASHWLGSAAATFVASGSPAARKRVYEAYFAQQTTPGVGQSGTVSAKYLIITYDTLRMSAEALKPVLWDAVVFDEVHYCVNVTSQRYKACKALMAKVKYGLTATPIMNQNKDIYGCLTAVRGPILGNYYGFINRYCVKNMWGSIIKNKNDDELKRRIAPYMVRKTWEDAGHIEPPDSIDLEFDLSVAETKLYNDIRAELLFELDPMLVSKLSSPMILQQTLTKLGKLQELTDSLELIGSSQESSKLDTLKEHLENSLTDDKSKAIIFTRFSRMAEILGRELQGYLPVTLTGGSADRQALIDSFTTDPTRRIFISTEAGGAGINLQAANIVYNYDLPFSLGKLEQRNGRLRHHMQDRPVFIYNLIARLAGGKKTIDHFVKTKILAKQEISDRLLIDDIKEMLQ